jgi:hypothetical protein
MYLKLEGVVRNVSSAEDLAAAEARRRAKFATAGGEVERGKEIAQQADVNYAGIRGAKQRRKKAFKSLLSERAKAGDIKGLVRDFVWGASKLGR